MIRVPHEALIRLQDDWQSKADQYQELARDTLSDEMARSYCEKAAGYRRAIRDLQDVIDSARKAA